MSRRLDDVAGALDRSLRVAEYAASERRSHTAYVRTGAQLERIGVERRVLRAVVFRDLRRGRGSAAFEISDDDRDVDALIANASRQAALAVGPAWRFPPPAAPARVALADPALGPELHAEAEAVRDELRALVTGGGPGVRAADTSIQLGHTAVAVARATTEIRTNLGLTFEFDDTDYAVSAVLTPAPGAAGAPERIRARARRRADLDLANAVAAAAERLRDRARAAALAPGEYDVALTQTAWIPGGGSGAVDRDDGFVMDALDPAVEPGGAGGDGLDQTGGPGDPRAFAARFGWLAPLVAQCDAASARRGLTRYLPGQSMYESRTVTGDPVTVISDGTLPYGLLSRPFGAVGEPVRRFAIVERGVSAGLALNAREAALRGVSPNGGVRNLIVEPGTSSAEALLQAGDRPLLEVADLAWLIVDPRTGAFTAGLGLSWRRTAGGARDPVVGGVWRGDVWSLLARARLSSEVVQRGYYRGPALVRVPRAAIQ